MIAIISDIHGNLEALQAVLADIKTSRASREIYCLGDVVGYGPNPRECIDLVMDCKLVLLGNHDQGAMFDPDGLQPARPSGPSSGRAASWKPPPRAAQAREKRWEFLAERPRSHRENGYLFVHGSARNPLNEYVFPEDIYNQRKMERIFALVERYCFQGHTHVPGIFTERPEIVPVPQPRGGRATPTSSTAARRCATSARSASRATATGGPATSCSTTTRSSFRRVEYDLEDDHQEDSRRPGTRSVPGRTVAQGAVIWACEPNAASRHQLLCHTAGRRSCPGPLAASSRVTQDGQSLRLRSPRSPVISSSPRTGPAPRRGSRDPATPGRRRTPASPRACRPGAASASAPGIRSCRR